MADMKLTAAQRKRLALEARRLAGEFAEGTAPRLDPYSYCGCAISEIMLRGLGRRAELDSDDDPFWKLAREVDACLPDARGLARGEEGLVSAALRLELHEYYPVPGAVVFPLLALADALESTP